LIVLDASAAVELLLGTERGARVRQRIGSDSLHCPHVLDLEVASALRRWVRQERISASRAHAALEDLIALPRMHYPHDLLLRRIWELRDNASVYDAAYLVLGEMLWAPVVTCDARVAGIPSHLATVEVI
jgi:predicted nucleic acid-binding protein